MKKIIKNIIFTILLIYTIGSVIFIINAENNFEKYLSKYQQTIPESEGQKRSTSDVLNEAIEYTRFDSKFAFAYNLKVLLIASTFVGGVLGLIISIKESSKIKYILYFIFGNILYNSILSIIESIALIKLNSQSTSSFINEFLENYLTCTFSLRFFLYYLIFVVGIVIIILVNTKTKVKKLNDELKKKQKQ